MPLPCMLAATRSMLFPPQVKSADIRMCFLVCEDTGAVEMLLSMHFLNEASKVAEA